MNGNKNNYQLLRIINEHRIPITIFICPDIVGTNRHFWWTYEMNQYKLKYIKELPEVKRQELYLKHGFDYHADFGERKKTVSKS